MTTRNLHDGRADGLTPLETLNLEQVHSFSDLVRSMGQTAFGGRQLGEALDVLTAMSADPACKIVLTVSGAMTVAKQGGLICDLIERGVVDAIVATGALVAHGLTESIGLQHYRAEPGQDDRALFEKGYNRIHDTLELEANLNDVERFVRNVLDECEPPTEEGWCSSSLLAAVGRRLDTEDIGRGILRSAYLYQVPVFVPAFTDSELGLDVATWAMQKGLAGQDPASLSADETFQATSAFNPFLDLQAYARFATGAKSLGILTIGGGVPRNWAQQVGPFVDITNTRVGTQLPVPRFRYAVRICPEPAHWGGLSGCTYSEGVSWGKFVPPEEGGRFAEVHADATLVWPLLMKALFEELDSAS